MNDIPKRHMLLRTLKAKVLALSHAEAVLPGIEEHHTPPTPSREALYHRQKYFQPCHTEKICL